MLMDVGHRIFSGGDYCRMNHLRSRQSGCGKKMRGWSDSGSRKVSGREGWSWNRIRDWNRSRGSSRRVYWVGKSGRRVYWVGKS